MTNAADGGKKARREHARELARVEREAEKRRKKRNKLFLQGGVIVVVLAIAAIVAVVISTSSAPTSGGPKNMASDGILFTGESSAATPVTTAAIKKGGKPVATDLTKHADALNIVTYIDYACPACQSFEQTNAAQIESLVAGGQATLEIHPIAILDRMSLGTKYSSRAANAAACVANYEPDKYLAITKALYAGQPAENTSGLDTKALKKIITDAGATSSDVSSCISSNTFGDWVTAATARVTDGKLASSSVTTFSGTPTVLVNGQQYSGSLSDPDAFTAFLSQVAAG